MTTWEIMNPSDPYLIEHDEFPVVAAATLILGRGAYGLEPTREGDPSMPIFLVDPESSLDWWKSLEGHGGMAPGAFYKTRAVDIAEALDSVRIPGTEGDADEREERHDAARTSMNDIGRRAWKLAASMREVYGPRATDREEGGTA